MIKVLSTTVCNTNPLRVPPGLGFLAFAVESQSRVAFATCKVPLAPVELATAPAPQPPPRVLLFNLARIEKVGRPPVVAPDPARSIISPKAVIDPLGVTDALSIDR